MCMCVDVQPIVMKDAMKRRQKWDIKVYQAWVTWRKRHN
jgi:hypothetical protein